MGDEFAMNFPKQPVRPDQASGLAGSGPYRGLEIEKALKLLAERIEEQVSTERAKWINEARQTEQQEQN